MSSNGSENPTSNPVTEGLKRKRGRPKKQPQKDAGERDPVPEDAVEPQPAQKPKKPRGRPKGSQKVTAVGPSAEKRPRGRPRKWPQAVVQERGAEGEDSQESSDLNLNSAPAIQGASGKDAPKSGKTTGFRRGLSNLPAAAQ